MAHTATGHIYLKQCKANTMHCCLIMAQPNSYARSNLFFFSRPFFFSYKLMTSERREKSPVSNSIFVSNIKHTQCNNFNLLDLVFFVHCFISWQEIQRMKNDKNNIGLQRSMWLDLNTLLSVKIECHRDASRWMEAGAGGTLSVNKGAETFTLS